MSSSDDPLSTAGDSKVAGPCGFMLRAKADDFSPGWQDTLPKMVIDLIDEAVIVTSLDLDPPGPKILYVNPGFTRLTGYSFAEVLGRNPRLLQGPATDRALLDRVRRDLVASGEFEGEAVNYRKDGAEYVIEWRIKALRSERGEVTHWLSIQRDVTRRKRAEDEQERLLRELDHRAKNALALVQGIVRLTRADDPVSYSQAVQARVGTVARAHSMLSDQQWNGLSLQRLLEAEVAPYARGRPSEGCPTARNSSYAEHKIHGPADLQGRGVGKGCRH